MTRTQSAGEHASVGFLLLLGAMSAFPPVTTDIYLPALPELTESLHGTTTEGQVTLAVYFVGLGFGQLFYGPWSDRIGRRPTMLIGAAIYLVASVGCALATTHAADDCSAVLAGGRGLLRGGDLDRRGARSLRPSGIRAHLLDVDDAAGFGPIVAPLAGGVIVTWLGWRAIFWAVTLFGVTSGSLGVLRAEGEPHRRGRSPGALRISLGRIHRCSEESPHQGYMLTSGCNFSCMFAWIAAAPYLVINLYKVPALYFGWIFGINAAGFMIAAQINRRLLKTYRPDEILPLAALARLWRLWSCWLTR